ncbi:TetR/AcrR family transcriptional regulator [Acinetobacter larvae]|uniref:TetR family transcriptional regulator n=1 Tax=Acinetobacter larvae TaxID=1789224 RepID=A0A1B2LYX9_9GAMM|nr:TetR/AcrR family transcriptional regulator [Acinetobacter larvae]AOA58099.1 TetR family transcriptional regulator [Acinetobacter larvae]
MSISAQPSTRGRPRTITHERITNAGIEIGLSNITFVGVAAALGVSHMALYKHVPSLEVLKYLVAEEIFKRWQIPVPEAKTADAAALAGLKEYLLDFTASLRELVKNNPGLTPYLLRRVASTQSMINKIRQHHQEVSERYQLPIDQARWISATIAFHCIAVADTVYSVAGRDPISEVDRAAEEAEMESEFAQSMQALIVGALTLLESNQIDTRFHTAQQQASP